LKHDQAHALLDLLGRKGQQRGGVRAHTAVGVGVAAREREASSEQREEEGVKTAHDAGLQRRRPAPLFRAVGSGSGDGGAERGCESGAA
jgi:hypothetical protein